MQVTLYANFAKLTNSTKRPGSAIETLAVEGTLKETTSMLDPVILIDFASAVEAPTKWTYAYIYAFDTFYFVNDWVWEPPYWAAQLGTDPLATYRTEILSSYQYVERSASNYDTTVPDTTYPTINKTSVVTNTWSEGPSNIWGEHDFDSGRYIVGIVNGDGAAVGGVGYYFFRPKKFREFLETLLTTDEWLSGETIDRSLFNPMQYIVSVLWSPFPIPLVIDTPLTYVRFGWWTVKCSCWRCSTMPFTLTSKRLMIPKHPQASRGKYLNATPYANYRLEYWPFGVIDLDSSYLIDATYITCIATVDGLTGQSTLNVYNDSGDLICTTGGVVGVNVQIAQLTTDFSQVFSKSSAYIAGYAAIRSGSGILDRALTTVQRTHDASLSGVTAAIAGAAHPRELLESVGNAALAANTSVTTQGSTGSIAAYTLDQHLICQFWRVVDEDMQTNGRPLCKRVQLSTLSGYCECRNPHVEISAPAELRGIINNLLGGGVYIE